MIVYYLISDNTHDEETNLLKSIILILRGTVLLLHILVFLGELQKNCQRFIKKYH